MCVFRYFHLEQLMARINDLEEQLMARINDLEREVALLKEAIQIDSRKDSTEE